MLKPILAILFPSLLTGQVRGPVVDRKVLAMGTELRLHFEGVGTVAGSQAALSECARIESECSTWNPQSAWSQLNAAEGRPVHLSQEWLALLSQMKAWNHCTEGAFDPVLMALMRAWGVREGGRIPGMDALVKASNASGANLLELDSEAGTARLRHPGAGLEEGGFLKGYALDRMRKAAKVRTGWLDFGGQILAWGPPYATSLADPQHRDQVRMTLNLRNASLSCSGTSERGRHILDPRSGQRCEAWGATAVVTAEALTADVLSTALYVLGPEAGLAWAERHDVAAAFLLNDGEVRMSRAFRLLHPTLISQETR
ncbi:MAG: FAD:protein FMN transferase [Geothrix sp.]|uniref:FAD:protein FMN transferase n=1 Tax=Geothrix sp. TaxID=1962974 RepID=UPI0017F39EEE|nr:FAD:protein FMN transferase [Geothrix sp.]NWJ41409.1 FAD:protein FMN transferase [Geothrix sp.]WIL20604.1 MAG: FAD:protein FMN transferase [Geothrix sp.]